MLYRSLSAVERTITGTLWSGEENDAALLGIQTLDLSILGLMMPVNVQTGQLEESKHTQAVRIWVCSNAATMLTFGLQRIIP